MKKILFSGIQPTGELHIGNYLGAMKQWVDLQNSGDFLPLFCVVDLHSITIDYSPQEKQRQILETAAMYLAAGIDPKKSIMFVQSHVPQHTELAWLFNCQTRMSDLFRMTQFKDKTKSDLEGTIENLKKEIEARTFKISDETSIISSIVKELVKKFYDDLDNIRKAGVGLFDYPVLMAADILLYKGEIVPVGEDQIQHIELAREIARRFNKKFGGFFNEPKGVLNKSARVMSLSEPEKKMSKSGSKKSYIALSDSPEIIRQKIKSAVTGTGKFQVVREYEYLEGHTKNTGEIIDTDELIASEDKGGANLLNLLKYFSEKDYNIFFDKIKNNEEIKYSELKPALAEAIIEVLKPIQEKQKYYLNNPKKVAKILEDGAKQARKMAGKNLEEIKKMMGLV